MKMSRPKAGAGLVVALLVTALGAPTAFAADDPSLDVSQSGAAVVATGSAFDDESDVLVTAKTSTGAGSKTVTTDQDGDFTVRFTPPAGWSGKVSVTADDVTESVDFKALAARTGAPAPVSVPTQAVPAVAVPTAAGVPGARTPAQVLDLTNWKLMLPTGEGTGDSCKPTEVSRPTLGTATIEPWFRMSPDGGVAFRSNVEGCTSSGSAYPRSELREMTNGGVDKAAWNTGTGLHVMTVREAITRLPEVKSQVVSAQIHDTESDLIEVLADGTKSKTPGVAALCYRWDGKQQANCLDDAYKLGTPFTLQLIADNGTIRVTYNGQVMATHQNSAEGNYFKAGSYTQSNLEKGDKAGAYGEVIIYALTVQHG